MLDPLNNERDCILRISCGDEKAFEQLFTHYRDKIYAVALSLTRSTTVAEEIVEDVFLKIWLRRFLLNNIENFSAYIYTIARNETYRILNQIAKNYNTVLLDENDSSFAHNETQQYLIAKEFKSVLQKAVDRLPHQQKQVYKLMKEDDLKRGEVAELLKIKPETVKFHLAKAMKSIRAFCMLHINSSVGLLFFLSCFLG